MKKALLILAASAIAGSVFGQGTILFSNAGLTGPCGSIYDALIKFPFANVDSFTVGLFLGDMELATINLLMGLDYFSGRASR